MPSTLSIENIKEKIKLKFPHEDLDLSDCVYNKRYVEHIKCNKCGTNIKKRIDHLLKDDLYVCKKCYFKSIQLPKCEVIKRLN